jgi:S1-C subfamily serine protease
MTEMPKNQNETVAPQIEEDNTTTNSETTMPSEQLSETQMPPDTTEYTVEPTTSAAQEPESFESIDNNDPPPPQSPHSFSSTESSSYSTSRGRRQKNRNLKTAMVAMLVICLLAGSFIGYATTYSIFNNKIDNLQSQLFSAKENFTILNDKLNTLQSQLNNLPAASNNPYVEVNANSNSNTATDLSELYKKVRESVVVIQCIVPQYNWFGFQTGYGTQQGSGFVTTVNGQQVIVTNNHVISAGTNITVTFADSTSYTATVLGTDAYADLAILKVNDMPQNIPSLTMISSSKLTVGDTVVAVGSPYGLTGTLTTGIISALGRTLTDPTNNRIIIPDIIQATAEINPGNSGGPLINLQGQVIGITTASVSNSQGLGFAIPSDTIIREIEDLINTGKYTKHPVLNVSGRDMTLQIANSMNIDTTYGWIVESATEESSLKKGDVIIKAGNTPITNLDDLLTYLERNTLPGQTAEFTVIRDRQQQTVTVQIVARNT